MSPSPNNRRLCQVGAAGVLLSVFCLWASLHEGPLLTASLGFALAGTAGVLLAGGALFLSRRCDPADSARTQFRSLLDAAPDAVLLAERDGRIVEANPEAERLFGHPREDLRGKNIASLIRRPDPAAQPVAPPLLHDPGTVAPAGSEDGVEHLGRRNDGREIPVEVRFSPLAGANRMLIIYLIRDVSERLAQQRRRAIRSACRRVLSGSITLEQAAGALLQLVGEGLDWDLTVLWLVDRSENLLRCLAARRTPGPRAKALESLCHSTGLTRGAGLPGLAWKSGSPVSAAALPEKCPRLNLALSEGLGTVWAFPVEANGEVVGVLELFRTAQGEIPGDLLETLGSIGAQLGQFIQRRQAEEATLESQARKAAVLEAALDGIITFDRQGVVVEFNPAAESLLGRPCSAVLGKSLPELLLPPAGRDWFRQALLREHWEEDGRPVVARTELSFLHAGGREVPVELAVTAIRTRGAPLFTAFLRDVSELRRQAETLHQKDEALRQAQKMEAVGRLAGGVAHDFNNLLVAILCYSDLLLSGLETGHPMREGLEQIRLGGERAANLTRQLLAFSRKQVLQPRLLDLNVLVVELQKMLRLLLPADIDLATDLASDLSPVQADQGQIEQVILNLAINARDAMLDGGRLVVETRNVEVHEVSFSPFGDLSPGRYVLLAVTDTGCGMRKEAMSHLFEPFFTTKEPGKGTGLGLATVYGIVQQSGGQIRPHSEPGKGTTFQIYLPRAEPRALPPTPSLLPPLQAARKETVLVAEDEAVVRRLMIRVLVNLGYSPLEARDGEEALALCENWAGSIDLLLTDVLMPRMNGPRLVERVRPARPRMRVLYVSGYSSGALTLDHHLEKGAAFLQKPFTPAELARKVQEVLSMTPR